MALSNSSNFIQNCTQIIMLAFSKLGVYGIGRTITDADFKLSMDNLNMLIKSWSTQGLHLWAREEGVVYLNKGQARYTLGTTAGSAMTTFKDQEIISKTTLAYNTGATSINIGTTTGITTNDNVGVVLEDNTIHWATANTVSSVSITLSVATPKPVKEGALVYTFTDKVYKPLRVLDARCMSGVGESLVQIPITIIPYELYQNNPAKAHTFSPAVQISYLPRRDDGDLYVWPVPDNAGYRIDFTYDRILYDLDTATDDFDFPAEWYEPIVWQLAARIAPDYGKEDKAMKQVLPVAISLLEELKNFDVEGTSVTVSPDLGDQ